MKKLANANRDVNLSRDITFHRQINVSQEKFDSVVLSGGGVKAIAHLGALHYFHEKGLYDPEFCKEYAGTSAGSIIILLLICGYTPMEILQEIYGIDNFFAGPINIWSLYKNYGIMSLEIPMEIVRNLVKQKFGKVPTLAELKKMTGKRFACSAVNITLKKLIYITSESHPNMECTEPCKLSSKLPVVFERISYEGCFYEDGGLADNFPIAALKNKKGHILGLVISSSELYGYDSFPFIGYLYTLIMLPINTMTSLRVANLPLEVKDIKIVSMDFDDVSVIGGDIGSDKKMDMFIRGYKEAELEGRKICLYLEKWFWDAEDSFAAGWDVDIEWNEIV